MALNTVQHKSLIHDYSNTCREVEAVCDQHGTYPGELYRVLKMYNVPLREPSRRSKRGRQDLTDKERIFIGKAYKNHGIQWIRKTLEVSTLVVMGELIAQGLTIRMNAAQKAEEKIKLLKLLE